MKGQTMNTTNHASHAGRVGPKAAEAFLTAATMELERLRDQVSPLAPALLPPAATPPVHLYPHECLARALGHLRAAQLALASKPQA